MGGRGVLVVDRVLVQHGRAAGARQCVALVVETYDLATGVVPAVAATGQARMVPYDVDRARRTLTRYLGLDEPRWDTRFDPDGMADGTGFVRLVPTQLTARDRSFVPAAWGP